MQPTLLITVDTEEDGLWGGRYERDSNTVENTLGIPRFQALCDALGVRPTYVIDTPVVEDYRSVDMLGEYQEAGRCEIGAHLHPWCAPPFQEEICSRNSYLCNLPFELQRAKLKGLTERIEERIGKRPRSFRAGRYGLDMAGARVLAELGYRVDSSVIPFTDYSAQGGPDFSEAPWLPYYLAGDVVCEAHDEGFLLEVPVSVGFSHPDFEWAWRWQRRLRRPPWRTFRLVGALDRLDIIRRIKFSPEQANRPRLKGLADVFLAQGACCLVMLFHSSSLVPGRTPYVPDGQALEEFYQRLESIFRYCIEERGMDSRTLTEFASAFAAFYTPGKGWYGTKNGG